MLFKKVELRLKAVLRVEKDCELAKKLNMSISSYTSRKYRESVPFYNIIETCKMEKIDMNYIFKD